MLNILSPVSAPLTGMKYKYRKDTFLSRSCNEENDIVWIVPGYHLLLILMDWQNYQVNYFSWPVSVSVPDEYQTQPTTHNTPHTNISQLISKRQTDQNVWKVDPGKIDFDDMTVRSG